MVGGVVVDDWRELAACVGEDPYLWDLKAAVKRYCQDACRDNRLRVRVAS